MELRRSLACTNIIENVMSTVRRVCRNVKRWRSASMAIRWTAPAMHLINGAAVTVLGYVAPGTLEMFEKAGFEGFAKKLVGQLQDPAGVSYDLDGLNPGELVEKPTATCVHEHGVALELHKLQDRDLVPGV